MFEIIKAEDLYKCISLYLHTFWLYFDKKQIVIKAHAIKRARQKGIAYPDHVYAVLKTGKVVRFGKNRIKFVSRSKKGSVVCVGEDIGDIIIIKTIERGN